MVRRLVDWADSVLLVPSNGRSTVSDAESIIVGNLQNIGHINVSYFYNHIPEINNHITQN